MFEGLEVLPAFRWQMAEEEKVSMGIPPETGTHETDVPETDTRETDVREIYTQTYAMYTC